MPMVTPPIRVDSGPPATPPAPREPAGPPVQPGIWLDAFTKGLNGEPIPAVDAGTAAPDTRQSPSTPDTSNTPLPSDKDE